MPKIILRNMKTNIPLILLLISFVFPINLYGQNINVKYLPAGESGKVLFSISSLSENNFNVSTDGIFSDVIISEDAGEKHVLASISVDLFSSDGILDATNYIWVCMTEDLTIKFYYPVGTQRVFKFNEGISLFSLHYGWGKLGAIDQNGKVIMNPEYDYISKNGIQLNGICDIRTGTSDVAFKCSVFELGLLTPKYHFNIYFDDIVSRLSTIHNEYDVIINTDSFNEMINQIENDNDARMYLWGIYKMFNLNYESALYYFNRIEDVTRFPTLSCNVSQCVELLDMQEDRLRQ